MNEALKSAEVRMTKTIEAFKNELHKIRTGRAHPSLLEHLKVSCYGSDMPLSQAASITISDARTLVITPWDKNMVGPIEKAIYSSDLGLNPVTAGQMIRVPLPPLTEERRRDLSKVVKTEAETARISIRNTRRDVNQALKDLEKAKRLTEDELKRAEEKTQALTDKYTKEIDAIMVDKEKELLAI